MKKTTAEPYCDIDFSNAKRGAVIPAEPGKTKVSICVDNAVIDRFDKPFDQAGAGGYEAQTTDRLQTSAMEFLCCRAATRVPR